MEQVRIKLRVPGLQHTFNNNTDQTHLIELQKRYRRYDELYQNLPNYGLFKQNISGFDDRGKAFDLYPKNKGRPVPNPQGNTQEAPTPTELIANASAAEPLATTTW